MSTCHLLEAAQHDWLGPFQTPVKGMQDLLKAEDGPILNSRYLDMLKGYCVQQLRFTIFFAFVNPKVTRLLKQIFSSTNTLKTSFFEG